MKTTTSERSRHILLRADAGELLPDALVAALRDEGVEAGFLRASGVVADVELRALRSDLGGLGEVRRITGPVQLVTLEGTIGTADGELSVGMRVVLARDTDRGMDAFAGELASARVIALDAFATALDDVAVERRLDRSGVWTMGTAVGGASRPAPRDTRDKVSAPARAEREREAAPPTAAWAEAIIASAEAPPPRAAAPRGPGPSSPQAPAAVIPPRPTRAAETETDVAFPEAGDEVEHFAFGRCDVLKSDGDRLHLKVGKDGRIKEIALEMLRVHPLEPNGDRRRFRLDRKM